MSGHGEKKSRLEDAAVAALMACGTVCEAAKRAGVGEATLRRWLQEPAFASHYRRARQQLVQHTITALQRTSSKAVSALDRSLGSDQETSRIAAARTVLEHTFRSAELDDLMARIDELERRLGAERKAGGSAVL